MIRSRGLLALVLNSYLGFSLASSESRQIVKSHRAPATKANAKTSLRLNGDYLLNSLVELLFISRLASFRNSFNNERETEETLVNNESKLNTVKEKKEELQDG
ncbi:hypothetical protein chiPu_0006912 [Chiloscyllium punctatum]|uniref:Uncharacterized protein n=1 Tax=Chiloscyllium punctatum TaxID=137246 RepID=A0A401SDI2_CHIPU|nr:hypothetical protein [Chiloscyllium punctatum]